MKFWGYVLLGLVGSSAAASVSSGRKKDAYDEYLQPVKEGNLVEEGAPFFVNVTNNNNTLNVVLGNDKFTMDMGSVYGTKLMWAPNEEDDPVDLIGSGVGLYASYEGAKKDLNYTNVKVVGSTDHKVDIAFYAYEGEHHIILFEGLNGFYSYFVNHNLPSLGEFRTLIRLNPDIYQNGHTSLKDGPLPVFPDDFQGEKVFDETWTKNNTNGTEYITKYDWSSRLHEEEVYGVYGTYKDQNYGFWLISPGRDYFCGDQTKQELMVHRESKTGDVVLLNMLHGTHFEVADIETFPDNKMWGPYLFYFNDGSISDANRRLKKEQLNWPYKWVDDKLYNRRSSLSGRLVLENGAPASGVNVFLGPKNNYTMLQGASYQYYGYTDEEGYFTIDNIRTEETYWFQAFPSEWSSKATAIGDVISNFTYSKEINLPKDSHLGKIVWKDQDHDTIFQIGNFDRTTRGFKYGGDKYEDFQTELCPGDFEFYVGETPDSEWCYAKSKNGTWKVHFELDQLEEKEPVLYVSLAGYTGNNSIVGGNSTILGVQLNGCTLEDDYKTNLYNDKSTYRSSSFAGQWFYSKLPVKKECLQTGENVLEFITTSYTKNYGAMWDSIKLVWQ